ncbi:MAG: starch-binding protein [Clostridia bacterium]|nr:starch-binding protein [Clostridia bacterium]
MKTKRILSLVLAVCTILSVLCGLSFSASAASVEFVEVSDNTELTETSANYGLAKNIQDGNILHCFDWKYNDIKAELKSIAEAGFTSVQTSPAQPAGGGEWYWLYQPYGFYIGTNSLGSKGDLQSLCQEAEKYGIKVIVDVVANHLNGDTNRVQDNLKDGQYWHNVGSVSSWADRYQVTHGEIGMRDLNSEHSYVQQVVGEYMKELEGIGVDGIRWDAAKHISLPSENCQFWPAVTKNNSMWHYGEILVGPADGNGHDNLMKEYTNYMSVTDSIYGMDVRNAFAGGNAPGANGNWVNRGIAPNKLVLWGESHDTWSNGQDWGFSNGMNQNIIDRAYAVVASRSGSNALYFSRPGSADKNSIHSGQKGSTAFKSKEIAAVNQLKNACGNEKDYYQNADNTAIVARESGAVIVLGSGGGRNVTLPNPGGTTKPGTYKELVTGSTWTVTNSQMSGQVGKNGIAVILNAVPRVEGPAATVTPGSTNYTTDNFEVTLNFANATSGQYSINGGAFQSFTNGQKIKLGKGTAAGTQTKISVKASNGSTTSDVETYEYNYSEKAPDGIYYDNSQTNWNSVNCYIYKNDQDYRKWPGEQMQKQSNNIWVYNVPAGFENCQVIFSEGGNNQYPAVDGLQYSGGAMVCDGSDWKEHTVVNPNPVNPTPSQAPTKPTETPTQPTQAPQPTQPKPTQPKPTVPKPTVPQPTQPKTEPTEDDIIIIPPAPGPTPTNPVVKPTNPNLNAGEKHVYGDLDANGKVSIKDATLMQKALAKLATLSTLQLIVSDVTADGKINVKDATTIQKYCAVLIKNFASGQWYTVPGSDVNPTPTQAPQTQPKPTQAPQPVPKPTEPPVTTPQPTQAPVTEPTEAPVTEPSVTDAPVTEPSVTDAPITEPPVTEPQQPDNYIYLKSTWSSVNCHSWPEGGEGTSWPGTPMESLGDGIFRIQLPQGHTNIVFNGDGQQTGDITVQGTGMIWDGSWQPYSNNNNNNNNNSDVQVSADCIYFKDVAGWGTVKCHSWPNGGDGTTWPGSDMESLGNGLYKIKLPDGHTNIVFNAGGEHCKTGDLNAEFGKAYNNSTNQWEAV